jgi:high-affinity iron transporter
MASQAVFHLEPAGYLTVLEKVAWDMSAILPQSSQPGLILHTLVSYTDRPAEMQLVAYIATIVAMPALMRMAMPNRYNPGTRSVPHLVRRLDDEAELRPLFFLGEDVAFLGRGEAALRA